MNLESEKNLKEFNTFNVSQKAQYFVEIKNTQDLEEVLKTQEYKNSEKFFLGGGSNVLFTKDFDGMVLHNSMKGIEITDEDNEDVWVRAMGGESWQNLVEFCVKKGYWGIENLSLIPGSVGAAPVQNIGAYGVELKDVLESVEAFDTENIEEKVFTNPECEFGYRESVFKNKFKGKYFIYAVTLRLSKVAKKNLEYKGVMEYIASKHIDTSNPKSISEAISDIRRSKLPYEKSLGTAGSFFKNAVVNQEKASEIKSEYADMPSFEFGDKVKIPTGWLIEKCGFKGAREGDVGVYEKHALILVNHGNATGVEVWRFAKKIISAVEVKFGIEIVPEVNIV